MWGLIVGALAVAGPCPAAVPSLVSLAPQDCDWATLLEAHLDGPERGRLLAALREVGWANLPGSAHRVLLRAWHRRRLRPSEVAALGVRAPDFHPTQTATLVYLGRSVPQVHLDGFPLTQWSDDPVAAYDEPRLGGPALLLPVTDLALLSLYEDEIGVWDNYWVSIGPGAKLVVHERGVGKPHLANRPYPHVCVRPERIPGARWTTGIMGTFREHAQGIPSQLHRDGVPNQGSVQDLHVILESGRSDTVSLLPTRSGLFRAWWMGGHIRLSFKPGVAPCARASP